MVIDAGDAGAERYARDMGQTQVSRIHRRIVGTSPRWLRGSIRPPAGLHECAHAKDGQARLTDREGGRGLHDRQVVEDDRLRARESHAAGYQMSSPRMRLCVYGPMWMCGLCDLP